jgi:hypothetical protein
LDNIAHNDGEGFGIIWEQEVHCFDDFSITTSVPNPITNERALTINGIGIATEIFQVAFIVITALIMIKQRTVHPSQREQLR